MKTSERMKKMFFRQTHNDRMRAQEHELTESLVDNYNLDTAQKAIMVEDLDLIAELNRKQLYRKTEIDDNGMMYYPEEEKTTEGEEDMSRSLQIGNNFHEYVQQVKVSPLAKAIPLLAAGTLAGGLIAAAMLLPKNDTPVEENGKDTNTDSVVRLID